MVAQIADSLVKRREWWRHTDTARQGYTMFTVSSPDCLWHVPWYQFGICNWSVTVIHESRDWLCTRNHTSSLLYTKCTVSFSSPTHMPSLSHISIATCLRHFHPCNHSLMLMHLWSSSPSLTFSTHTPTHPQTHWIYGTENLSNLSYIHS